jgi:hypothetical protein
MLRTGRQASNSANYIRTRDSLIGGANGRALSNRHALRVKDAPVTLSITYAYWTDIHYVEHAAMQCASKHCRRSRCAAHTTTLRTFDLGVGESHVATSPYGLFITSLSGEHIFSHEESI